VELPIHIKTLYVEPPQKTTLLLPPSSTGFSPDGNSPGSKCAKSATWKGDPNNWKEEKDHPVRKYFRDKLKDQPSGTIVFAMSDQWEVRIFFGWVNKDNKARLNYMEIAYETDVG
jgi:hypothetical protein